jgi:hypothetical protein
MGSSVQQTFIGYAVHGSQMLICCVFYCKQQLHLTLRKYLDAPEPIIKEEKPWFGRLEKVLKEQH